MSWGIWLWSCDLAESDVLSCKEGVGDFLADDRASLIFNSDLEPPGTMAAGAEVSKCPEVSASVVWGANAMRCTLVWFSLERSSKPALPLG